MNAPSGSVFACIKSEPLLESQEHTLPYVRMEQHRLPPRRFSSFVHAHDFICIYLTQQSHVSGRLNGVLFEVEMNKQEMHLLARGVRAEGETRESAEILLCTFHPDFIEQLRTDIAHDVSAPLISKVQLADPLIYALCIGMRKEFAKERQNRFYAESLALALGAHIVRNHTAVEPALEEEATLSPRQLYLVREFIESNLADDLSIEALASQINFSPYYFSRLFKQAMGTSPYNYIVQRRIEAAKRLLRTTQLPIEQIALSVGYGNASHFSRLFKQRVKLTPRAFRRRCRVHNSQRA